MTDPPGETSASRLDGRATVGLNVTVKSGANVIRAVNGAKQQLEQTRGQLPPGVQMVITRDASVFTTAAVSATAEDLILAILLASLVVLIFLQSFRQTLIVLVSIPTSLLATTLMMKVFDFGLDVISLLAMSLLIGILVDDAVVVIENITRHLSRGADPVEAAVRGRMEIGGAAVALTLTDVVVFAPIALSPGMIGDILIEISVTIVVSTLFSLLVSFTLVPMLAARWLKPAKARQRRPHPVRRLLDAGISKLEGGYVRVLRASLRHRLSVLVAGTCCLLIAVGMVASGKVGTALTPDVDSNVLGAEVALPSGTSIAGSSAALATMSERLRDSMPDITQRVRHGGALRRIRHLTVQHQPDDQPRSEGAPLHLARDAAASGRQAPGPDPRSAGQRVHPEPDGGRRWQRRQPAGLPHRPRAEPVAGAEPPGRGPARGTA